MELILVVRDHLGQKSVSFLETHAGYFLEKRRISENFDFKQQLKTFFSFGLHFSHREFFWWENTQFMYFLDLIWDFLSIWLGNVKQLSQSNWV